MTETKLKNCPFCGAIPKINVLGTGLPSAQINSNDVYVIECPHCEIRTKTFVMPLVEVDDFPHLMYRDYQEFRYVVSLWNNRVSEESESE